MSTFRKIDGVAFNDPRQPLPPLDAGPKPQLRWIAIDLLRINPAYQRNIHDRGAANVRKIAREFNWSKFGTVIVSEESDRGIYLVIDGQHRTTAAALRGIRDVPCQIVKIDEAAQASAFAAINGNVTALTPMHIYHAKVAAGDPDARALAAVLKASSVTICRYPVPANQMKPGETLAAGKLPQLLRRFGADVLGLALRCITQTRKGNVGLVRAPIIAGLCVTLDAEPAWQRDEAKLIRAMQSFDLAAAFDEARRKNLDGGGAVAEVFIEIVSTHLERKLNTK